MKLCSALRRWYEHLAGGVANSFIASQSPNYCTCMLHYTLAEVGIILFLDPVFSYFSNLSASIKDFMIRCNDYIMCPTYSGNMKDIFYLFQLHKQQCIPDSANWDIGKQCIGGQQGGRVARWHQKVLRCAERAPDQAEPIISKKIGCMLAVVPF